MFYTKNKWGRPVRGTSGSATLPSSAIIAIVIIFFASPVLADYTITSNSGTTDGASLENFGRVVNYLAMALPATTIGEGYPHRISICLQKDGTPTDNIQVSIESDLTGVPNNNAGGVNPLTLATTSGSSVTGSPTYYDLIFTSSTTLSASTQYWVVLSRTGTTNDTNFYRACGDGGPNNDYTSSTNYNSWTQANANGEFGYSLFIKDIPEEEESTSTSATTTPSFQDLVFGQGVIIFFLASIFGTYMVSIFRRKKND